MQILLIFYYQNNLSIFQLSIIENQSMKIKMSKPKKFFYIIFKKNI